MVGKGKTALLRRPANSRKDRLISKNQLWRFCSTMKVSKARKWRSSFWEWVSLHYPPLWANFLLICWWWDNRMVLQESCSQPEFTILYPAASLGCCRRKKKKKKKILLCLFLEKEKGPCFIITLLVFFVVVVAPSLLLHFLPFLTSKCLHLTFGTKGRAKKLNEILSYKWDTEDMERFCTWEDHRVLLPFIASYIWESILIILWLYRVSYGKHSLWKSGWNISYLKITGLPVSVIMASLH